MKFANPKTDFTFKRLFGDEQRKNLTMNFLNNLLERKSGNLITQITFCDNTNVPEMEEYKYSSVDVNCTDQSGARFIIEMQVAHEVYFLLRSQYYASCALSRQLKKGVEYQFLKPVIFVGIMNHTIFDDTQDAITHNLICNSKTGQQTMHHLEFHYVELSKFNKELDELVTEMDKWLYFFKKADDLEIIPEIFAKSLDFVEAFHVVEQSLWTPAEHEKYRKQLDVMYRDEILQAGLEERGRQEGLEEGIQKGALKEKEAMAINALHEGLNVDLIVKLTSLSVEQIQSLKK